MTGPARHIGFTLHVTLAWLDPDEVSPRHRMEPVSWPVDCLYLAAGHERVEIPLGGATS